ncbi:MAG: hypothetical protein ISS74_01600 [Planctomycetes bacterium]|nr:hypothetical protein [Planctomycetota bacterium]
MPEEPITKLKVAERQLSEAIRLFFERRDIVAVHTLAAASDQVLSDICVARGMESQLRHHADFIRDEACKEYFRLLKRAENFFKHADRDPEGILEFRAEQTVVLLFDSVVLLWRLTQTLTHEARTFLCWLFVYKPDWFRDGPFKESLKNWVNSTGVPSGDLAFFSRLVTQGKSLSPHSGTFPARSGHA